MGKECKDYTIRWENDDTGKCKGKGSVCIGAVTFRFSVSKTSTQGYLYRVHMSVISPMDGMVLMVDGERRQNILKNLSAKKRAKAKKGMRISELTACTEFYLNTDDEKEIKQKINEKALELNGTYCREINRALDMPANRDLTTAEAFQSRGEKFIADITRNCSSERSRTQLLRLERLCCELSYKEMSNITAEDIRSLLKKMGVTIRPKDKS